MHHHRAHSASPNPQPFGLSLSKPEHRVREPFHGIRANGELVHRKLSSPCRLLP